MDQGKITTETAVDATPADAPVVASTPWPVPAPKASAKSTGVKPGAKHKAPPTFFSSFMEGLTHPSLSAAIGTLAVALAWFLAAIVFITPGNLALIDERYLMTVDEDDYTEVSLRAFRIAQQPVKPAFAVAIFGTSGTRAAIADEKIIEKAVADELGTPAAAYFLAANAMSLYEIAGLMDAAGDDFRGIVMIHVGPYMLSDSGQSRRHLATEHRLAFQSKVYDDELRLAGIEPATHTGNYFLDNWKYFSTRTNDQLLKHVLLGPPQFVRHRFFERAPLRDNPRGWNDMVRIAKGWMNEYNYRANRQNNKELIDRIVSRLRIRNRVELVLVEVPRHPQLSAELFPPPLDADHRAFMTRWATEPGVHYFELDSEAELTPDDMHDYIHMRTPAGQMRYTRVLAEKLRSVAAKWRESR